MPRKTLRPKKPACSTDLPGPEVGRIPLPDFAHLDLEEGYEWPVPAEKKPDEPP